MFGRHREKTCASRFFGLTIALSVTTPEAAYADEGPASEPEPTTRPIQPRAVTQPAPSAESPSAGDPGLGWWIVASSLATGVLVTTYGLQIDCDDGDTGCQRRTSLAIMGGVGVASLGSLVGITIVQVRTQETASGAVVKLSAAF